jgi:hypothetical protein
LGGLTLGCVPSAEAPHGWPCPTPHAPQLVAEGAHVDPFEQRRSIAEEDRGDRDVQLVDESGTEVLPDRVGAAADPDVTGSGGLAGALQRLVDPAGDEVEGGAAGHRDRVARMVCAPPSP